MAARTEIPAFVLAPAHGSRVPAEVKPGLPYGVPHLCQSWEANHCLHYPKAHYRAVMILNTWMGPYAV